MGFWELFFTVYAVFGFIMVLVSVAAIVFGDKFRLHVGDDELHGWRKGIVTLILLILVFLIWPVVLVLAAKD